MAGETMEPWVVQTKSKNETQQLGSFFALTAVRGDVITLEGPLGSGKTTFSQGFAKGLGIQQTVNSPTFVIFKTYSHGRIPLYHMDVYRLEGNSQDLGLEEYIGGDGVALIEWPQFVKPLMPHDYIEINFQWINENERHISLLPHGERSNQWLEEVKKQWTTRLP